MDHHNYNEAFATPLKRKLPQQRNTDTDVLVTPTLAWEDSDAETLSVGSTSQSSSPPATPVSCPPTPVSFTKKRRLADDALVYSTPPCNVPGPLRSGLSRRPPPAVPRLAMDLSRLGEDGRRDEEDLSFLAFPALYEDAGIPAPSPEDGLPSRAFALEPRPNNGFPALPKRLFQDGTNTIASDPSSSSSNNNNNDEGLSRLPRLTSHTTDVESSADRWFPSLRMRPTHPRKRRCERKRMMADLTMPSLDDSVVPSSPLLRNRSEPVDSYSVAA